jgi:excisionase family DNA binding protein
MNKDIGPDQLAYSVDQVARLLHISRATAYELAKRPVSEGGLPTVQIGARLRVPRAALEAMLARPVEEAAAAGG